MSLINKVLRDLEARERGEQAPPKRPVLDDLRPASKITDGRSGWFGRILGLLAVVAATVAVTWWYVAPSRVGAGPHAPTGRSRPASPLMPAPVAVLAPHPLASRPAPHPSAPKAERAPRPAVVTRRPAASRAPFVFQASGAAISRQRAPMTVRERARAAYRRAVRALQAGRAAQARAACELALSLNPKILPPALLLATLDLQGARLRSAREVLRAALKAHPRALPAAMLLAQVDLRRQQPAAAARRLVGLRAAGAANPSYWALLAVSQWRAGDQVASRATYRSALRRFPRDGALWVGLGLVDRDAGKAARAYRAWRHAAACPLSPVLARFVRGQMRASLGARQKR